MASATQTPELLDEETVFAVNNIYFNQCNIVTLTHGVYTCVFVTALWSIFVSRHKYRGNTVGRKLMLAIIITLYILETISVGLTWAFTRYSFITHGQTFRTVFSALNNISAPEQNASALFLAESVGTTISGGIQNVLSDFAMIWRCWTVWGNRWLVVFVPTLCMIAGIIAKVLGEYADIKSIINVNDPESFPDVDWTLVYLSLTLAVTLLCTILIVFRIVTVGRANRNAALGGYRSIVEIVIESAALLSIILVIYIVTYARGAFAASIYVDAIAGSIRGIAPTLLVGRVASGHSRPDETWKGSVLSSLHFGSHNHAEAQVTTQYNDQRSTTFGLENGALDSDASLEESKPATGGV